MLLDPVSLQLSKNNFSIVPSPLFLAVPDLADRGQSATPLDPSQSGGVHGFMLLCGGETQPSVVPSPMAGGRAGGLGLLG